MDMSKPRPSGWAEPSAISRYAIAVLSVAIAMVAAELLTRMLHTEPIASSMLCAVIFAAWFGGFGPGLLAIALSLLAVHYYLVPPINSFVLKHNLFAVDIAELPRLVLFSITSLFVNFMSSAQRSAKEAALQAEGKTARAEREIRLVTDMIPALVWSASPDGAVEYFNRRWLAYTGLTLEQARGWGFVDAYHPEDRASVRNFTSLGIRHGASANDLKTEARLRGVDGKYRWFLERAVALRDEAGNIVRWFGTTIDIEDRKRAEDALRQSEAYLAEAQRLSRTGSFGWNVSSGEILWSEESYRIFEYDPPTKATIEIVLNRVHPDDVALVREVINRATTHKEAFDFEHRLLMPDGSVKHLNVVAHPLIDQPDELLFVGAVMDITARKKSEEALRNSEQRYRHLFQYMPIALWQLNASKLVELFKGLRAEGVTELGSYIDQHPHFLQELMDAVKIEEVNERAIEMLGARDASEILGSLARLGHIHPDTFLRGLESRLRGEPTFQEETKVETLDGRVIDVLLTATRPGLVTDPDMSLVGIVDITERVRAQEMLHRVQADFAHAARVSMLGELTASIAHEVNQPLAAISINGEVVLRLLNRSEPDLAEVRELTKCVVNDARRAADVIARVRTTATRQAPEPTLLSVDEVIREALLFLRHEVQSHGLMVTHHFNPAPPKVLGDHTQLQQVFVNLTVNAIHAMTQMGTTRRMLVIRTTLCDPRTLCCRAGRVGREPEREAGSLGLPQGRGGAAAGAPRGALGEPR
jgi:PAS domain S-box-containing protein